MTVTLMCKGIFCLITISRTDVSYKERTFYKPTYGDGETREKGADFSTPQIRVP